MTPDRWRQICEVFEQASGKDGPARAALLAAVGRADPALRDEVEAMLRQMPEDSTQTDAERSPIDALLDAPSSSRQMKSPPPSEGEAGTSADPQSHRRSAASMPPQIPDYQLIRLLGRGAFGQVWLANSLTRVYRAVKLMPAGPARDVEFEGIRTCHTHASDHPHLIQVLHVGATAEYLYCVMELADGYRTAPTFSADTYEPRSLQSELQRRGGLAIDEAIPIVRGIASALGHLHQQGLLHRDVKPSNIVFVNGVAKLADIGLLTPARRRLVEGNAPLYAPPEGVVDRSGDFYCLGKTFYEILTGRPPVDAVVLPLDLPPNRHAALVRILPLIQRACAADPAGRFHNAAEFVAALDGICPRKRRFIRVKQIAGCAIMIVGLAAVGWLYRPRELTGEMEIAVKDPRFGEVPVSLTADLLPLRDDDQIRMNLALDPPAYPLVFRLSRNEPPELLYPTSISAQQKVASLTLPEGELWRLEKARDGAESFMLVAFASSRAANTNEIEGLSDQLQRRGIVPAVANDCLLLWNNGSIESVFSRLPRSSAERSRGGPRRGQTVTSQPTVLERLNEPFEGGFSPLEAIVIPQQSRS